MPPSSEKASSSINKAKKDSLFVCSHSFRQCFDDTDQFRSNPVIHRFMSDFEINPNAKVQLYPRVATTRFCRVTVTDNPPIFAKDMFFDVPVSYRKFITFLQKIVNFLH